mgnify:CR=1 FL=1
MKKYFKQNINKIVCTTILLIAAAFVLVANIALWQFVLNHLKK